MYGRDCCLRAELNARPLHENSYRNLNLQASRADVQKDSYALNRCFAVMQVRVNNNELNHKLLYEHDSFCRPPPADDAWPHPHVNHLTPDCSSLPRPQVANAPPKSTPRRPPRLEAQRGNEQLGLSRLLSQPTLRSSKYRRTLPTPSPAADESRFLQSLGTPWARPVSGSGLAARFQLRLARP